MADNAAAAVVVVVAAVGAAAAAAEGDAFVAAGAVVVAGLSAAWCGCRNSCAPANAVVGKSYYNTPYSSSNKRRPLFRSMYTTKEIIQ